MAPWTFDRAGAGGLGKRSTGQFPNDESMNYTMRRCSASLGLSHTIAISSRCVDVVVRVELRGLGGFDLATIGLRDGKERMNAALE
jgi:hypothetical protein